MIIKAMIREAADSVVQQQQGGCSGCSIKGKHKLWEAKRCILYNGFFEKEGALDESSNNENGMELVERRYGVGVRVQGSSEEVGEVLNGGKVVSGGGCEESVVFLQEMKKSGREERFVKAMKNVHFFGGSELKKAFAVFFMVAWKLV